MKYLDFTIKAASPTGSFTAVASAPTIDRDGEVLDAGCFEPLPASIPVHAFHDFKDPVGRARPFYQGTELMVEGTFATTDRAQEIRALVLDKTIGHVSVGFLTINATDVQGTRHITQAELLEVSLVSIPSNREAAVLSARGFERSMTPREVKRFTMKLLLQLATDDLEEVRRIDRRTVTPASVRREVDQTLRLLKGL